MACFWIDQRHGLSKYRYRRRTSNQKYRRIIIIIIIRCVRQLQCPIIQYRVVRGSNYSSGYGTVTVLVQVTGGGIARTPPPPTNPSIDPTKSAQKLRLHVGYSRGGGRFSNSNQAVWCTVLVERIWYGKLVGGKGGPVMTA